MIPVSSLPQWLYAIPWLSGTIGPRVHSPWPIAFELYESIKDDYEYIDHALKNYYALRNMPKNFELDRNSVV